MLTLTHLRWRVKFVFVWVYDRSVRFAFWSATPFLGDSALCLSVEGSVIMNSEKNYPLVEIMRYLTHMSVICLFVAQQAAHLWGVVHEKKASSGRQPRLHLTLTSVTATAANVDKGSWCGTAINEERLYYNEHQNSWETLMWDRDNRPQYNCIQHINNIIYSF